MNIAIIGGGAAGFFAAIAAQENYPDASVVIFEKSKTLLHKVKISGGGRCNVTNACAPIKNLACAYPRGERYLKKAFQVFNNQDVMRWFESRGVALMIEDNQCVFPVSENSQSIIDCFLKQAKKLGITIAIGKGIKAIKQVGDKLKLEFISDGTPSSIFDKVIVATGGSPKRKGLTWLEDIGHKIKDPVPSLFTFNMPDESITALMGLSVEKVLVNIQGSRLKATGPLLITHWGMSGPVILKLSALGARLLNEHNYQFKLQLNWINVPNNASVMTHLKELVHQHPHKLLSNVKAYSLPDRLWRYLLNKCGFPAQKTWSELGKKGLNKLVHVLTNDIYAVEGKTTFKEEFVTCGGISLESIDFNTMQSKVCKNLYFAGELMDIDGITGGYNFQAAWTTAFIAAQLK